MDCWWHGAAAERGLPITKPCAPTTNARGRSPNGPGTVSADASRPHGRQKNIVYPQHRSSRRRTEVESSLVETGRHLSGRRISLPPRGDRGRSVHDAVCGGELHARMRRVPLALRRGDSGTGSRRTGVARWPACRARSRGRAPPFGHAIEERNFSAPPRSRRPRAHSAHPASHARDSPYARAGTSSRAADSARGRLRSAVADHINRGRARASTAVPKISAASPGGKQDHSAPGATSPCPSEAADRASGSSDSCTRIRSPGPNLKTESPSTARKCAWRSSRRLGESPFLINRCVHASSCTCSGARFAMPRSRPSDRARTRAALGRAIFACRRTADGLVDPRFEAIGAPPRSASGGVASPAQFRSARSLRQSAEQPRRAERHRD